QVYCGRLRGAGRARSYRGGAHHRGNRAARRRLSHGLFLRGVSAPVVGIVATTAILADVVAVRPRGQVGPAVEALARLMAWVARPADKSEHQGVLGGGHRGAAEGRETDRVAIL